MKILPAVTTIFDWRGKIKEVKELGLKEVALFLTCVNHEERKEIFSLLENVGVRRIPFVHTRTDMAEEEFNHLIKKYHAKTFNIHTKREFPYPACWRKHKGIIYIENTYEPLEESEIKEFAGICLDFGHLENSRLFKPNMYKLNIKLIDKYGCGCNHVGPAKDFPFFRKREVIYSRDNHPHTLKKLSELNYLKNYPAEYFGEFAALEMENSIKEQLVAMNYIINMLK